MDHSPKLKAKIIKLFPQNKEVNLYDSGVGSGFSDMKPKEKTGFINIKNFYSTNYIIKKIKKTVQKMGENICKSYV